MEKSTELGGNKTGVDMSPIHTKRMVDTSDVAPADTSDESSMLSMKRFYFENADPLGSVPIPGTVKGALKSTMKMATGHHPEAFINKLGERLAFERVGVRIYEQLIIKCTFAAENGMAAIDLPLDQLREFRDQEAEHFEMLVECFNTLGADPTAQTPDADASSVGSSGLLKVIVDPRTSLSQTLESILSLELIDNAGWELLIKVAQDMSLPDMAARFEHALQQEETHLAHVRKWYEESVRVQGKVGASKH